MVVIIAWKTRFILDDAFISLRYARNLAEGNGLVWNPGEFVEGYTNFLWTLIHSLPFTLGLDPVGFSQVLGILCMACTLWWVASVSRQLVGDSAWPLCVTVLLGTNATFVAYGTSGLETSMQTLWLVWAAALVIGAWRHGTLTVMNALAVSCLLTAAVMTRLDSAVIGVWIGVAALTLIPRQSAPKRLTLFAALTLPFISVIGLWFSWKMDVYGDILPNTYFAKASDGWRIGQGAFFLKTFVSSYWLWPWCVLSVVTLPRLFTRGPVPMRWLVVALLSWLVYLLRVGGDFMEFRFLVPVLPVVFLWFGWIIWQLSARMEVRVLLGACIVAGSLNHRMTFTPTGGIESIDALASHLYHPVQDWEGVGKQLATVFEEDPTLRIATTAAGAIPYHAGLPTVDMLGLTDPWIAHRGRRFDAQIGHERIAPLSYLLAREVHLVLGQPWLVRPSAEARTTYAFTQLRQFMTFEGEPATAFPPHASILELPMPNNRSIVLLYLTPHPAIETMIARKEIRRFTIVHERRDEVL